MFLGAGPYCRATRVRCEGASSQHLAAVRTVEVGDVAAESVDPAEVLVLERAPDRLRSSRSHRALSLMQIRLGCRELLPIAVQYAAVGQHPLQPHIVAGPAQGRNRRAGAESRRAARAPGLLRATCRTRRACRRSLSTTTGARASLTSGSPATYGWSRKDGCRAPAVLAAVSATVDRDTPASLVSESMSSSPLRSQRDIVSGIGSGRTHQPLLAVDEEALIRHWRLRELGWNRG